MSAFLNRYAEDDSPFAACLRYWLTTGEVSPFDSSALDEFASCASYIMGIPAYSDDETLEKFNLALTVELFTR